MKDRNNRSLFRATIKQTPLVTIFDSLPADLQSALAATSDTRILAAGEIVIADASVADHVGYVLSGVLAMRKSLADHRTHIIGILMPTDMYGRVFYGQSTYQVEALTKARVVRFDRAALENILLQNPALERQFLLQVLDELDAMREWIVMLGARRIVSRVASFLLIISRRMTRRMPLDQVLTPAQLTLQVPIRRINLAQYLGTSVESLSRAMQSLARDGVITTNGANEVTILDHAALMALAGDDGADDETI